MGHYYFDWGLEHGFKTRLDPGLKPDRVEEKTGEEKTRCDLAG